MRVAIVCLIFAGCAISRVGGQSNADPTDGSIDAPIDDIGIEQDSGREDSAVQDGQIDAPTVDATVHAPTAITDLGRSGDRNTQPSIVWDGTDFVIAAVNVQAGSQVVQLYRMAPGGTPGPPQIISVPESNLGQTSVVSGPAGIAASWLVDTDIDAMIPPESIGQWIYDPVARDYDRTSAALYVINGQYRLVARLGVSGGDSQQLGDISASGVVGDYFGPSLENGLGEIKLNVTSKGPIVVLGGPKRLFVRTASRWEAAGAATNIGGRGDEGAAAELAGGTLITIWLHGAPEEQPRTLTVLPFLSSTATRWNQGATTRPFPRQGVDPILMRSGSNTGTTAILAYVDTTSGREMAFAEIDNAGGVVGTPCAVPGGQGNANDPALACAAGWCAAVWMDSPSDSGNNWELHVIQVPVEPRLVCP